MLVIGLDVGSVRRAGGFSWVAVASDGAVVACGCDLPDRLGGYVVEALDGGEQVALAIESPLAIPIPDAHSAQSLGLGRSGEGGRPWSAGAGSGVLATGLAQLAWLCRYIGSRRSATTVTTRSEFFLRGDSELLLG